MDNAIHAAILRILEMIAPMLRTLSFAVDWSPWLHLPLPASLPALVELSIQHHSACGNLRCEALNTLKSAPLLHRLILTGFYSVVDPHAVLGVIKGFSPSLGYIYVPLEPGNVLPLINEMVVAMKRESIYPDRDNCRVFPETLEGLFVEGCKVMWADHERCSNLLKDSPRVFCKERPWQWEGAGRMHSHWLARLEGDDGYWSTDNRIKGI